MSPHTPARRTILCVQTEEEARTWLSRVLPMHECIFASTAYDAVRNLHTRSFDAYVLDYWLPDWSGASLCREIRKYDPNSPVVFLTEGTGEEAQKRAGRAGASAYLRKPCEPEALLTTLGSLFEESELRSLRAKSGAEQAVRDVFRRSVAKAVALPARDIARSLERIARARAYEAFIACGGTRAHFENWWPQVFDGARAGLEMSLLRGASGSTQA